MSGPAIDPRLEAELSDAARNASCELIHVEFKGGILRLILDRPEGVTLADCELVSKQASAILDVEDFSSGRYVLEVSSPGLDRQLYRAKDYERFVGHKVRVTFIDPEDGNKKTVRGLLDSFEGGEDPARDLQRGEASVVDSQTGKEYTIPLRNIQLARLEVEL